MKCTFTTQEVNILCEAQPGDLFAPLGPTLVDCCCAVRSRHDATATRIDLAQAETPDPDTLIPVVVVACRVAPGDEEYYPVGYSTWLPGSSPIAFLELVEAAAFRVRPDNGLHIVDSASGRRVAVSIAP